MKKSKQKLLDDIKNSGWHVIKVMESNDSPRFAYSVGLYETFKHPEIIFIGMKFELMHILINNIGHSIKKGVKYEPNYYYSNILDNFNCLMIQAEKENYDDYVGQAQWYYNNKNFPLLQCVYPTIKGFYPWENEWPEDIKSIQPLLGEVKTFPNTT